MPRKSNRIDRVVIRMYRMGTGDCFTVKFMKGRKVSFTLMIDCGCWSGSKKELQPFIEELKKDVDNHIDVLVVTHEHKDHVLGFERCEDLFTDDKFEVDQTWMAWTENDGDDTVEQWKRDYGEKKKALAVAAMKLNGVVNSPDFTSHLSGARDVAALQARRQGFAEVLQGFVELHGGAFNASNEYIDGLAGMDIVKTMISKDKIKYLKSGKVIEHVPGLDGVRIFVLGPPALYDDVKAEEGPAGEAYEHNDDLEDTDAFAAAVTTSDTSGAKLLPFDDCYVTQNPEDQLIYNRETDSWRKIDHDWLFSAGSLALRMNSRTNNLSLVLAIEFIESGKVLLFPGDAEYGSWKSWHKINWKSKVPGLTTEAILNRVIFYKVAHHLSHHGTARSIGLEMMNSPDLTAMATLHYGVIPSGWKSTMPNVGITKDLLERTKGRTLIMSTDGLLFDRRSHTMLVPKLNEYRKYMTDDEREVFKDNVEETELYISLTIDV